MRLRQLLLIFFVSLISLAFVACTVDDQPVIPEVTVSDGTVDYFTQPMNFPSSGGFKVLSFSTNVKWTLSISGVQDSGNWCSVSQPGGDAGTFNIIVSVGENALYDDRSVVLVLSAGDIVRTVAVTQGQKDALTLSNDRFEIGIEGGTIDVELLSNVDYKVEIPEPSRSWISQIEGTRALSKSVVSFSIAESKEYDKREGEIRFLTADGVQTVKVYQSGSAILVLSQNEFDLGSDGGTVSVEISSNFDFDVDMPDVNWIAKEEKTRAVSSHTLLYSVSPNDTYDDREAVIVFKDSASEKKESVTIRQKQKDAVILSSYKAEVPQDGGVFAVDVNSNVDYTFEIAPSCKSWLSETSEAFATRALTKSSLYFKATASENYEKREGAIFFRHGELTDTLRVYQSGGAILVLGKDSFDLRGTASTISVELKSNIDYTVTTSGSWISEVATRAVSSSTRNFSILSNDTGSSRTGTIEFKSSDGTKTATVTVNQAALIKAESLTVNFVNASGTMGGNLYIGRDYGFSVSCSPSNADVSYEWEIDDTGIAAIEGNGSSAVLKTKDYGKAKVTVTEKNSGVSKSYDFATCVTNFKFTETSRDTRYGYPVITIAIDGSHQLDCSYSPSSATRVFSNLSAFNFKELYPSLGIYTIVEESSVVDIDENGLMTAKKIGTTIIEANNGNGVYKNGSSDGIFVNVVEEIIPYGTIGGHGYVDLDLPSGKLWATSNFGALKETEAGSYYKWSSYDRITSSWGSKWSTPTISEFRELVDNCTYEWTTQDGVNGYAFTGRNGARLFLPAVGFEVYTEGYGYSRPQSFGSRLMYWTVTSSSYSWEGQSFAYAFDGSSSSITTNSTYNTTVMACPIRPISR